MYIYMYKRRKKQHSKQKSGVHTDEGQHRTEEYQKAKEEETEGQSATWGPQGADDSQIDHGGEDVADQGTG